MGLIILSFKNQLLEKVEPKILFPFSKRESEQNFGSTTGVSPHFAPLFLKVDLKKVDLIANYRYVER